MIFYKDPITYDARIDQPDIDETLLAFAVTEKIQLILAVAHPLQSDQASEAAAAVCKEFIQDRFLQFSTWMPGRSFSWIEVLKKHIAELKHWIYAKEETQYDSISKMIWFNWFIVIHPRTAFLISIGDIHTHLLRHREWQSFWEIPVDFSLSDTFAANHNTKTLPSIALRQLTLQHGDTVLMANKEDSIKFALCLQRKEYVEAKDMVQHKLKEIKNHLEQLHLPNPAQSIGLIQVL